MHPPAEKRALAVIPARFASARFPGKPLLDLLGVPMVVRVAEQARKASRIQRVIVATDDPRILRVVEDAGFECVMTPSACASGTDRIACALGRLRLDARTPDLIVNVQGDEPLIDPRDIDALVEAMADEGDPRAIGTLARRIDSRSRFSDPNVVKVVVGTGGQALYFSRAPIPAGADPEGLDDSRRPLQHVGLYAYPSDVLQELAALPRSRLEDTERLEQLRALEYGIPIRVAMCSSGRPSLAIDVPEDVEGVLSVLRAEGDDRVDRGVGADPKGPIGSALRARNQGPLEISGRRYGIH